MSAERSSVGERKNGKHGGRRGFSGSIGGTSDEETTFQPAMLSSHVIPFRETLPTALDRRAPTRWLQSHRRQGASLAYFYARDNDDGAARGGAHHG